MSITLKWLHDDIKIDAHELLLVERRYMTNKNPFNFVSCLVFKRKDTCIKAIPTYLFGLAYYNFFFQAYIPFCDTDKQFIGKQMMVPYIPTPLDSEGLRPEILTHNLSSAEKVSKEEVKITLKVGKLKTINFSGAEQR